MTTIPDSVVEAALLAESRHYDPCCSSSENYKKRYPEQYAINMAAMRAALEAAAPMLSEQWIPCSERMPEDNTEVMVHCAFADEYGSWTGAGFHVPTGWKSQDSMIMDDIPIAFPVTHWMPLPQPPKEAKT
jgi:hypothetical protein